MEPSHRKQQEKEDWREKPLAGRSPAGTPSCPMPDGLEKPAVSDSPQSGGFWDEEPFSYMEPEDVQITPTDSRPARQTRQRPSRQSSTPSRRSRAKKRGRKPPRSEKPDKSSLLFRDKPSGRRKKDPSAPRRLTQSRNELPAAKRRPWDRRQSPDGGGTDAQDLLEHTPGTQSGPGAAPSFAATASFKRAAAGLAAGTIVLISRLMQLASFLMMALMTAALGRAWLSHAQGLGTIEEMMAGNAYGLALYMGAAGSSLLMCAFWCLWILSKKGAGGGLRLKRYDTGRGLIPFLLCLALIFAANRLCIYLPASGAALTGLAGGAAAVWAALASVQRLLFWCSAAGAVLSLARKLLSV